MSFELNTEQAPRFVLDVPRAQEWLTAVADGTHLERFDAPSAYDLTLSPDFSLDPHHPDVDLLEFSGALLRSATELEIIHAPDWVEAHLEDMGDGDVRVSLSAPALWGDLGVFHANGYPLDTGVPDDRWAARGVDAAMILLGEFVREANIVLSSLVTAAEVVLAQLSNDPGLLTRLADSDEPLIRHLAAGNPAAPDEARVLSALKDANRTDEN